ncbi:hypothetical protein B1H58_14570 [Pantoea alhagi]|uniref:Glycosyl transferase family 1 domain-containing protein n=1 Tax=Pantoea alhagi TaxID=1891675 RepID=A0A1W6B7S1_9GAMM|nr:glycosyltransferase [Pantoea alhagi]ARJ43132.1 hypothetical protein B1H58_14570 [Pantoea alhagi]
MKKIILNCTTNNTGGAIQNAVNFINEIINNDGFGFDWYFFLSPEVAVQVKVLIPDEKFFISNKSPAQSFVWRKKIYDKANEIEPDLIYTSAGPAYVNFKQTHIMGCSNPYILGATKESLRKHGGLVKRLIRRVHTIYQRHYIRKAKCWIVQTEESKRQLKKIVGKRGNIFIVYNAISAMFFEAQQANKTTEGFYSDVSNELSTKQIKILVPSAWYAHKDLETVPSIIKMLIQRFQLELKVTFTIDTLHWNNIKEMATQLGVEKYICNYGPFSRKEAVHLYLEHDVILQPSLLEVFSTSYIESMAVKKPLVVPFLPFSKDICGEYAYYYVCNDYNTYVNSIISAIKREDFTKKIISGNNILQKYGTQQKRTENMISIIKSLLA